MYFSGSTILCITGPINQLCISYVFFRQYYFIWLLTQILFRTCVKAADQLWIISRHYHGGYASPCNGNGYDLPTCGYVSIGAFYGGYAHHSSSQQWIWICFYQNFLWWICFSQLWICLSSRRICIGLYQNVLWWICFSWLQSWICLSKLKTAAPWARIWTPKHRTVLSF